jgi:hypothetical protein
METKIEKVPKIKEHHKKEAVKQPESNGIER